MIITFDGYTGSGKTTHTKLLSSATGIPILEDWKRHNSIFLNSLLLTGDIPNITYFFEVFSIMSARSEGSYILDGFFWQALRKGIRYHNAGDLLFAKRAFELAGLRENLLSFCLVLPDHTLKARRVARQYVTEGVPPRLSADLISLLHKGQDKAKERDRYWNWIASEFPFFHVIDGTQSEDAVHKNIMSILNDFSEQNTGRAL